MERVVRADGVFGSRPPHADTGKRTDAARIAYQRPQRGDAQLGADSLELFLE
jgi:hypothetical protein